jgi:hypothetical protein
MKYALNLNEEGRILSVTYPQYAPEDAIIVDIIPERNVNDYLYTAEGYVYDPIAPAEPVEPGPTQLDVIEA